MNYNDLQKANETVRTMNIKGKEYAQVNERIKAFRMLYPEGLIRTELVSNDNGVCIFRAYVGYDDKLLATGTAYEREDANYINKTSYIENCETSAVGRALGMLGIGIDTSVASAEEVEVAVIKQDRNDAIEELREMAQRANVSETHICTQAGVERLEDLDPQTYGRVKAGLQAKINIMKEAR